MYPCLVWSTHAPKYLIDLIESIQKKVMKIIKLLRYYEDAIKYLHLKLLGERPANVWLAFIKKLENPSDRLHSLLPAPTDNTYKRRKQSLTNLTKYQINRHTVAKIVLSHGMHQR